MDKWLVYCPLTPGVLTGVLTGMKKTNTQKVREYRQRLKADPERWAAYRAKQSGYQRICRKKGSVSTPVSTPTPEERAALLAAFDEPSVAHLGGKHAAPATVYHGIPPEALIKQYQEHHAKQLPVPLDQHPFINALRERIPCTLVKELPTKEKAQ